MGVEIHLSVDFRNVGREQWEAVYDETLELIDRYQFLDEIVDEENYLESFIYADRTRDRYLTPWSPNFRGWHTIGDLDSFECGESFFLIRDIGYYKDADLSPDTGEIYFNLLDIYGDKMPELYRFSSSLWEVFSAKTQGLDYHTYLLAIAALIEDRLKPHAMVSGDITRAQLQKSVQWANGYLETSISLPDRCSYTSVLSRIQKWTKKEAELLDVLFSLLLYPRKKELGNFIRESFSGETIRTYWVEKFKSFPPDTLGMWKMITSYLDMHFALEDLCTILVSEDNGIGMTPKECVLAVLKTGILNKEQQEKWVTTNNQDDPYPETISTLFGKTFMMMSGVRDFTSHYIEESELKKIFYSVLPERKSVDEAFGEYKMGSEPRDTLDEIMNLFGNIDCSTESGGSILEREYDIEGNEELIYWKEGASIAPGVERNIQKLLDFSDSNIEELKHTYGNRNEDFRMQALLIHNRYFLIRKETWDYVRSHILDDTVYFRFLSLLIILAEEIKTHNLLRSICNNRNFLTHRIFSHPIPVKK